MSLQDNLWHYFVEPNEFSFLNFNTEKIIEITAVNPTNTYSNVFFEMVISLDSQTQIAERVVKDAVTLFADIGGFSGFLMTILGFLVGSIPSKLFNMSTT